MLCIFRYLADHGFPACFSTSEPSESWEATRCWKQRLFKEKRYQSSRTRLSRQIAAGASSSGSPRHSASSQNDSPFSTIIHRDTTLDIYHPQSRLCSLCSSLPSLNSITTMSCGDFCLALIAVLFPPIAGKSPQWQPNTASCQQFFNPEMLMR